jgi:hypothetical protein
MKKIRCKGDGRVYEVAMVSAWPTGKLVVGACIYLEGQKVCVLNPEPPGKNLPEVRFEVISDLTDGA